MTPGAEFLKRSRYYIATEYITKIRSAVGTLPEEEIWRRSNSDSNSIANLLAHLSGNIRQWIVEGVGGTPVYRDRALEFSRRDYAPAAELLMDLERAVAEVDAVLSRLDEAELSRECTIQGRRTTAFSAIFHVVEHFAMHTGQIVLLAKQSAPGSIRFYDDAHGNAVPLWGGTEGTR